MDLKEKLKPYTIDRYYDVGIFVDNNFVPDVTVTNVKAISEQNAIEIVKGAIRFEVL